MLGRLRMDVDECIRAYVAAIQIIFEKQNTEIPKFFDNSAPYKALLDSKALYNAVRQIMQEQNVPEDDLFNEPNSDRQCRT